MAGGIKALCKRSVSGDRAILLQGGSMPDRPSLFFQEARRTIRQIALLLPEIRVLFGELVFTAAAFYGFIEALHALMHH